MGVSGDFVNGTLFYNGAKRVSISTIVQNGEIIAEQGLHDNVKRGHFVVYKNGTVGVEMFDFVSRHPRLKDMAFCVGGFNIMPDIPMREQFKLEWFDYNTVGYRTWRTMLGYNKTTGKALVVMAPNLDAEEGRQLMKKLGCDCGIGLDGGGSTCGRMMGKVIRQTTRVIHNIIRWWEDGR